MSRLPAAAHKTFRKVFIPTYVRYIGTLSNPWEPMDNDAQKVIMKCWAHVYGDTVPLNEMEKTVVYGLVSENSPSLQ